MEPLPQVVIDQPTEAVLMEALQNKQAVLDAIIDDGIEWARIASRNLRVAPNACCAVRGHPPGSLSHYRWLPGGAYSPLGVGGHIGPVELRWPGRLK